MIELILTLIDHVLDFLTRGSWSEAQGAVRNSYSFPKE